MPHTSDYSEVILLQVGLNQSQNTGRRPTNPVPHTAVMSPLVVALEVFEDQRPPKHYKQVALQVAG